MGKAKNPTFLAPDPTVDSSNHFKIVTKIHSRIVEDDTDNFVIHQHSFFGKRQTYPHGLINPAFTGFVLWEIQHGHPLNDYKISRHHNAKSGIMIIGNEA